MEISLGKNLLKHLGVEPGEKVAVNRFSDGGIELKGAGPGGRISDVFNMLKRDGGPSLSIEQMNEISARSWSGDR
jgi:hypothetical protein